MSLNGKNSLFPTWKSHADEVSTSVHVGLHKS
jgi:hypothetical protein